MATCRSSKPAGLGRAWGCSLPSKHRGDHAAKNEAGVVVARWSTRRQNVRNRPAPEVEPDPIRLDPDSLAAARRKARLAFDTFGDQGPIQFRDAAHRFELGPDLEPRNIEPIEAEG